MCNFTTKMSVGRMASDSSPDSSPIFFQIRSSFEIFLVERETPSTRSCTHTRKSLGPCTTTCGLTHDVGLQFHHESVCKPILHHVSVGVNNRKNVATPPMVLRRVSVRGHTDDWKLWDTVSSSDNMRRTKDFVVESRRSVRIDTWVNFWCIHDCGTD